MIEPLNAAEPATQLEVMKIDSEQVNDVFMCFSTGSSHEDANDVIASGGICYSWQYRVCVCVYLCAYQDLMGGRSLIREERSELFVSTWIFMHLAMCVTQAIPTRLILMLVI